MKGIFLCVWVLLGFIYSEVEAGVLGDNPVTIVNGTTAAEGEFPYAVQIIGGEKNLFLCGGSLIGDKWVLTAGHCAKKGDNRSVVYGTNILYDRLHSDNIINVTAVHQHPKFSIASKGIPTFDMSILELAKAIRFSNRTQPVKLPDADKVPFHVNGTLAGWGVNITSSITPQTQLQKIGLQLLNDTECTEKIDNFGDKGDFNSTQFLCSDVFWNGECYGDSGSPFVINGTQYGLVSWSWKPCGIVAGAYSRISNPEYRDFIRNVTKL